MALELTRRCARVRSTVAAAGTQGRDAFDPCSCV